MKQKRFRFLTLILSFSLLATIMLTNSAFALSNDSPISSQEVVYKTVSAMDSHDWDTYVALQSMKTKPILKVSWDVRITRPSRLGCSISYPQKCMK